MVSKTYRNDGLEGRPTTILTGVTWVIDPSNNSGGGVQDYMSRFQPFNSIFIRNNDSNELQVDPNGSPQRRISLPQGATVTILNEPFNSLYMKNIGSGTIAHGNITVKIEKIFEAKK